MVVHIEELLGDSDGGAAAVASTATQQQEKQQQQQKKKRLREGSGERGVAAPKASKNAYLHFSMARRAEVAALSPDWTVQQVSAEVGRQWKALTQHERKPWVELAQFDKARFHTELEQYIEKRRAEEVRTCSLVVSAAQLTGESNS